MQPADERHDPAEVDAVAHRQHRVGRRRHLEDRQRSARTQDAGHLAEHQRSDPRGCATRSRTSPRRHRRRRDRQEPRVGLDQGRVGARVLRACRRTGRARSDAGRVVPFRGTGRRFRPRCRARSIRRASASESRVLRRQPDVHAERHEPVDQVVTGRDGVEHRADGLNLFLAFGQGWRNPGHASH